jgi:hypothetical protein
MAKRPARVSCRKVLGDKAVFGADRGGTKVPAGPYVRSTFGGNHGRYEV